MCTVPTASCEIDLYGGLPNSCCGDGLHYKCKINQRVIGDSRKQFLEVIENYCTFDGSRVTCASLDQCIGRHVDRLSTDISVNILTNIQLICRSTYRLSLGWYIDRDMLVDILTDLSTEISAECRSTYCPTISRCLSWYINRYVADWLLVEYQTVSGILVDCCII